MATSIRTFELQEDMRELSLKKGDYITTNFVDFYTGAGVYGLSANGMIHYAYCIEQTSGKIQIKEIGSMTTRVVEPQEFKKLVKEKIFARTILDGNLPTTAIYDLRKKMIEG
ncbi:MAG: hypothetical protein IJ545_07010 [Alphaproteobacteria bacterium]|nr:hypothetical protein [Alphaproteobacteria bacterium]